jgi:glycosyltransferase involved in cell wall biosynthesis
MKISIIIPNRNDTVMLGVTVRSAIEALKAIDNDGEIIVADNSDSDIYRIIKKPNCSPVPLIGYINDGILKYVRQDFPSMYSAYELGAQEAQGEYLFRSDSHVMYGHNVLKDCISFMDNNDIGFGFSPIGWWNLHERMAKSHISENKNGGIFGTWGKRIDLPAKIPWNFGFRIVRKDWYEQVGGFGFFAKERISWGGGEFYIAMKSWLFGRENWAMPASPMYHIGPYSKEVEKLGYRFRQYGASGNGRQGLGILSAFYALGGDEAKEEALKSKDGLKDQYGLDVDRDWKEASKYALEDRKFIEANQTMTFKELLEVKPWRDGT